MVTVCNGQKSKHHVQLPATSTRNCKKYKTHKLTRYSASVETGATLAWRLQNELQCLQTYHVPWTVKYVTYHSC